MEAVPRLPMISFELKVSPKHTDFGKIKEYIKDHYHEDPELYNNEVHQFESLRSAAVHPAIDVTGCSVLKRYFCQLQLLENRFPMGKDEAASLQYIWKDIYAIDVCTFTDISVEILAILYNIGALHTQLGASETRLTAEGMKLSCTHFQCAAWAFQQLKDKYPRQEGTDLAVDLMSFMNQVCLAQAQECILEKSMMDSRKAVVIAKVAVQTVDFYYKAYRILTNTSSEYNFQENVGSKTYKKWEKYLKFKSIYYDTIALLYQGQQAEEQQKMGERVTFYQAALDKLEEARKQSKGLDNIDAVNDTITFTLDVVEGKRKAAKNENEFIYHEEVPNLATLGDVKGASLVDGIPFDVNDPEVSGPDILAKLVPMKAHECSSLYSEEKAKLLRKVIAAVEQKDKELEEFMDALQLDKLSVNPELANCPQELLDCCAGFSAKPDAVENLLSIMTSLTETFIQVEGMLKEISKLLKKEDTSEKEYQNMMGKRPPSIAATDLTREAAKYEEAHQKAFESNMTLNAAVAFHVPNLKLLVLPFSELCQNIPSVPDEGADRDPSSLEMTHLLRKVEEMQKQRSSFAHQLRVSICEDDITRQIITHDGDNVEQLFQQELKKHDKIINLMEHNLSAQENIIKAIKNVYATYAVKRKAIMEEYQHRDYEVASWVASFHAYEDLLTKAQKGLDFYCKLEKNVTKLLQRVKATCKVQEEEREQIMAKNSKPVIDKSLPSDIGASRTPKLKDYLDMKKETGTLSLDSYQPPIPYYNQSGTSTSYYDATPGQNWVPGVRPAPVGSERTEPTNCSNPTTKGRSSDYTNVYQNHKSVADSYPSVGQSQKYKEDVSLPPASQYQYPHFNPQASQDPSCTNQYFNYQQQNYNPSQIVSSTDTSAAMYPSNTGATSLPTGSYPSQASVYQSGIYPPQTSTNQYYSQTTNSSSPYHTQYPPNTYSQGLPNQTVNSQSYTSYTPSASQQANYPVSYTPSVSTVSSGVAVQSDYSSAPYISQNYSQTGNSSIVNKTQEQNYYNNQNSVQYDQQGAQYGPSSYTPHGYVPQSVPATSATGTEYNTPMGYSCPTSLPADGYASGVYTHTGASNQEIYHHSNTFTSHTVPPYGNFNSTAYTAAAVTPTYTNTDTYTPSVTAAGYFGYQTSNQVDGSNPNETQNAQYYYNPPYGYQYSSTTSTGVPNSSEGNSIYMQAGAESPLSTTTSQNNLSITSPKPAGSNVDLLAGLDFNVNQAPMVPEVAKSANTLVLEREVGNLSITNIPPIDVKKPEEPPVVEETVKATVGNKIEIETFVPKEEKIPSVVKDPYLDTETLNNFVQEVEKFEKFVEGLTLKTLNGPTTLEVKWKEIVHLQEKDAHLHNISVARCYPMKNRFADILPYDDSRVELPSTKDEYINASHLKNLTKLTPSFILTQAPLPSTYADFWTMVYDQQVEIVICLLSDAELEDQIYWPVDKAQGLQVNKFNIVLQSTNVKPNWIERIFSLCVIETRVSRVVIHLQYTAWPGSSFPPSPALFLGFVSEVINYFHQQRSNSHPVVVHCTSGVGRTGLLCLLVAAITEIQAGRGLLDLVTTAAEMSHARKCCLRDREHLKFAYQTVLYFAQDLLMKRGILTSRSTFEEKRNRNRDGKCHTRHPSEDFLLAASELSQTQSDSAPAGTEDHAAGVNYVEGTSVRRYSASSSHVSSGRSTPSLPPQNMSGSSELLSALDPSKFTLDLDTHKPTKAKKKFTADSFMKRSNSNLDNIHDSEDPLSQLDPLWSLKK